MIEMTDEFGNDSLLNQLLIDSAFMRQGTLLFVYIRA